MGSTAPTYAKARAADANVSAGVASLRLREAETAGTGGTGGAAGARGTGGTGGGTGAERGL
ncbi:hypothetical protein ABZZ20_12805 [Streptomyces sp. NPDC006430]|uniref:hypothetical protein n=1 Tax=Streptomyces sp. NPDC006430 TaxID=3154299 RepID=UPI0033BEA610